MAQSRILKQCTVAARGLEAHWPAWMQMAKAVPEVRLDKVKGTRKAVEAHSLESDEILDITIERLSEDLEREEES